MGQLSQVSGYQLQALQECAEELRSLQEQVRLPDPKPYKPSKP